MDFKNWILSEMPQISMQGKTVLANDQPLKQLNVDAIKDNIVIFRIPENTPHMFEPGTTWVYFLDSEEAADRMAAGEIPMLTVPQGTFYSGGDPINDVWKEKFAKKGTEHILGILEGYTDENQIYVKLMTVRPKYKRNTINSKMIQFLKEEFPKAEVTFSSPTPQGQKFIDAFQKPKTM